MSYHSKVIKQLREAREIIAGLGERFRLDEEQLSNARETREWCATLDTLAHECEDLRKHIETESAKIQSRKEVAPKVAQSATSGAGVAQSILDMYLSMHPGAKVTVKHERGATYINAEP